MALLSVIVRFTRFKYIWSTTVLSLVTSDSGYEIICRPSANQYFLQAINLQPPNDSDNFSVFRSERGTVPIGNRLGKYACQRNNLSDNTALEYS